jgi:hypothetical protein
MLHSRKVRIDCAASDPFTTHEVLASMHGTPLRGKRVVVQRYGQTNRELQAELESEGAGVIEIVTYRWGLPEDTAPLLRLIGALDRDEIDLVAFTSASQVSNLSTVAQCDGKEASLKQSLGRTLVASIATKGQLIGISSPYAQRGVLYTTFCKHYGQQGSPRILVAKASSLRMNSTIDPEDIADAYDDDPVAASSEYGGEFRVDIESFVGLETVLAAVEKGIFERPPRNGVAYLGFADPSGGHSDSYTLAIAHSEGEGAASLCSIFCGKSGRRCHQRR